MKKFIITSILFSLFATGPILMAQGQQDESLGLPGDNLNLYAVMKLFQESETLEGFEKDLNDENSRINNLDLDGNDFIDYIRVIDDIDGNVHNIILQVAINERENQDVAVFTVQREDGGKVYIQLIGDEALYGKDYIIEPIYDEAQPGQTPNPGYTGNVRTINGRTVTVNRTTFVEIAAWPLVRYIYLPTYAGWRSSWYYGYYPAYWHPWHPYYYHYYYGYHYNWHDNYYAHYHRWNHYRYTRWNDYYYTGRRSYSPNVSVRIRSGNYKSTYSRPEQRRDGEAMYTKMHPDQNNRSSDRSSGNSSIRRDVSKTSTGTESPGTGTNRRPANTVTNKSVINPQTGQKSEASRRTTTNVTTKTVTNPSSGQKAETTRRSTTTVINKSVSNPSSGQKAETNRKPATIVTHRPASNTSSGQKTETTRRSTSTVTNKTVSNPSSGQKTEATRPSKKTPSTEVTAPERSNSDTRKSVTPKNPEKAKESETIKDTRRK